MKGMWLEGAPYEKESIYKIEGKSLAPVNYDIHKIKSHSLTHAESSKHTQKDGFGIEHYFKRPEFFWGKARLVRLKGDFYKLVDEQSQIYHWEVSKVELQNALDNQVPDKLLLTTDNYPKGEGTPFHDPSYVLTLSQEAADWLVASKNFHFYGTSWKSSDFKPGKLERPIHDTLFKKAIIMECLDLEKIPEGEYFFVGVPLPLWGASEAPVSPMLFTKEEWASVL